MLNKALGSYVRDHGVLATSVVSCKSIFAICRFYRYFRSQLTLHRNDLAGESWILRAGKERAMCLDLRNADSLAHKKTKLRSPKRRSPKQLNGLPNMKTLLPFVVFFSSLMASTPLRADLILNGSFEAPNAPSGSFIGFVGGSSFSGWNVVGSDVAVVRGDVVFDGITLQAQSGVQWLDLSGNGSNLMTNGVRQDVSTTIGAAYELSFWVGSAQNANSANNIFASTVRLSIDGGTPMSFTNPTTPRTMLDWRMFTHSFNALNTVTSITFLNGSAANNELSGFDNVSLTITAVPEPSSLSFVASCFLGLGILLKRRGLAMPKS